MALTSRRARRGPAAMRVVSLLLLALFLGLSASTASAQFTVTTVTKTAAHPYFGTGHPMGFAIDGVEGGELMLVRGQTYTFTMDGVQSFHPFYITTSDLGGGGGEWTEGVTGNFATGTATLTFVVPASAPDLLWYQCGNHQQMGWRINVTGTLSTDGPLAGYALALATPNPTAGAVRVRVTLGQTAAARVEAFDASGRRVATLHDGPLSAGVAHPLRLDTQGLAAGVYTVRATSGTWAAEQRVTVVR